MLTDRMTDWQDGTGLKSPCIVYVYTDPFGVTQRATKITRVTLRV